VSCALRTIHIKTTWESGIGSLGLHSYFFGSCISCVVKEGNWLSESNIKLDFAIILLNFDISNAFANIVEICWRLNDIINQVGPIKKTVSASFLPEVEEVMLKQLHVSHQIHIFCLNIIHFILQYFHFSFIRLFKLKIEDLNLQLDVINGLFTMEFVLLNPLLKFGDVLRLDISLRGKLVEVVRILN